MSRLGLIVSGAVFLISGASLVTYIYTGLPLPLVLAVLVLAAGAVAAALVLPDAALRQRWRQRLAVGVPVGLLATGAYDLSRWLLVEVLGFHASPFAAFPLFGQALLMGRGDGSVELVAGLAFHLLNGCAFGCAYAVWFGDRRWYWGIGFALGLEAFMLTIYPGWLDIRSIREFTTMSVLGHVAYGTVLGVGTGAALARRAAASPSRQRA